MENENQELTSVTDESPRPAPARTADEAPPDNTEQWRKWKDEQVSTEMPLCPVHKSLDDRGQLELSIYSHHCLACALAQREEILKMLVPFMLRNSEDAISVLERIITVNDRNYKANYERGFQDGAKSASASAGWVPIESAPKDGRTLLLGYRNLSGKWRTMRGQWYSDEAIAQDWEEPEEGEEGWYETSAEADYPPNAWKTAPTHWMPLPPAPEVNSPARDAGITK